MMYPTLFEALRGLPDTSAAGFEGFVKALLDDFAAELGIAFLSKAGYQQGVDASSAGLRTTWAGLECKHYDPGTCPRAQELVGGLGLAINGSSDQLDLWLLVTTGAVGANHAQQLRISTERTSTAIEIIDWQEAGLPRLAVLCAAVPERTLAELKARTLVNEGAIQRDLAVVAAHTAFSEQLNQLKVGLSAAYIGYSRATYAANAWIDDCFRSSQNAFARLKQSLCPRDEQFAACIDRPAPRHALNNWFARWQSDHPVAIVVGAEGTGKSWALATWLATLPARALTLLVTSNMTLGDGDGVTQLARAICLQVGQGEETQWRARLHRWLRRPPSGQPLVLLILDGLNERPLESWIARLSSFRDEQLKPQVALAASCWRSYWEERLEARMPDAFRYELISIGPYDDSELATLLSRYSIALNALRPEVTAFLRNPRIFRAAIEQLPRLMQTGDLTIWRLLVTEAQFRLKDRPQIELTVAAFNGYIIQLARELAHGHQEFSKRQLIEISRGDAMYAGSSFAREIEEIAAGKLFERIDFNGDTYRVLPHYVPLALGMVIADEVRNACRHGRDAIRQILGSTLEQYGGFSEVAEIIHGAVACACLWPKYPQAGVEELLLAWLGARNRSNEQQKNFAAYLVDQPDAYLNVAERVWPDMSSFPDGRNWIAATLLQGMRRAELFARIVPRVNRWLSLWSSDWHPYIGTPSQERLDKQRRAIAERWASATLAERTFLESCVIESETPANVSLSELAFLLVSSGARTPFVKGFAAWALTRTLMGMTPDSDRASWCLRLNRTDSRESEKALVAEITYLRGMGGAVAGDAARKLARALGTRAVTEGLPSVPQERLVVNAVAQLSLDALDPECQPPALDKPLSILAAVDPAAVYTRLDYSDAEHRYEEVEPALAAFAPNELGRFVRSVLETALRRDLMGTRQLALFAVRHAQLIDGHLCKILESARSALLDTRGATTSSQQDRWLAESQLLLSVFAGLDAATQFERLTKRPFEAWMLTSLEDTFVELPKEGWNARLEELGKETNVAVLRAGLWFLSGGRFDLTPAARRALEVSIRHEDPTVRSCALQLATNARDAGLLRRHTESRWHYADTPGEHLLDYVGSVALAATAKPRYSELRERVHPELLGWLASRDGSPEAFREFAVDVDLMWCALTGVSIADRSRDEGLALLARSHDSEMPTRDHLLQPSRVAQFGREAVVGASGFAGADDIKAQFERMMDPKALEREEQKSSERAAALIRVAREKGTKLFEYRLRPHGLSDACRERPDLVSKWITALDANEDELMWRAGDFYRAIAAAIATDDPGAAASLLRRIRRAGPRVLRTTYEPLRIDALMYESFLVPDCSEAISLRYDWLDGALTDDDLFQIALVAQEVGRSDWLLESIENGVDGASLFDQARALTLLGFLDEGPALSSARPLLDGHLGFLERVAKVAATRLTYNERARHWFGQHLSRTDETESWAAMRLSLRCVDRRYHLWSPPLVDVADGLSGTRRRLLAVLHDTVYNAIERNEGRGMLKLKESLFGTRIAKGQLVPWY